jgi:hypothetical protein
MTRAICGAAVLMTAALLLAVAGGAATLPGGTAIDAVVTSPLDGATLPDAPLTITGKASVGEGAAVANTTLIYVVDVSNSTGSSTGGTLCPNQNVYDPTGNTTLDCELLAVRDLNADAIAKGTVAKIGVIGFAGTGTDTTASITSAAALDLDGSGTSGTLVPPDFSNFAGAGLAHVFTPANNLDWVVQSAFLSNVFAQPPGWPARLSGDGFMLFTPHAFGSSTNYYAALTVLRTLLAGVTTPQTQVVFLSDGQPNLTVSGQPLTNILNQLPATFPTSSGTTNLTIDTFAVTGAGSTCGTNPPSTNNGSLEQVAQKYGKHCHPLLNPEDATTSVPDVISSTLTAAGLTVDGSAVPTGSSPSLPITGPGSVALTAGPLDLGVGPHELCATATGKDGAGTGSAGPSCIHVTIKAAPTVTLTAGAGGTILEGGSFPVSATVDGSFTSSTWSASGGTGHCTPADPSALNTTFTCDDDGDYTLTLDVTDGVNPAAIATGHLHVTNVAPTTTLSLTPSTVPLSSATTHAHADITDPGADAWTCLFTWGDGSTDSVPATARACDAPHTYTAAGPFPVHVEVTDDDGGMGGADGGVVVQGPPVITGEPTDGAGGNAGTVDEGSLFPIPGSVDGASSLHWSSTGGTGHCVFSNDAALPTSVRCDDNGMYTLTLEATDSFGQHSSASFHLQVDNVAPSLTVSGPVSGSSPRSVTFNGIVTDPGANDTLQCTIDWGDGTTDTVAAAGGFCSTTHTYDPSLTAATITATAKDDDGGVSAPRSISLNFNRAPVCIDVRSSLATLWPANHKLVLVTLGGATDPDGDAVTYAVTGVRQDEALTGGGSGSTAFDAQPASGGSVYIRAERAGAGDGRVYTISFTVRDPNGASCSGTTTVSVPHDQAHPAVKTPGVSVNSLG